MVRSGVAFLIVLLCLVGLVSAQQTCNSTQQCGSAAPCCSPAGYCSTAYCYSGCNPYNSYKPTSCHPNPICQDKTIQLTNTARIAQNVSQFRGNWTKYDLLLEAGRYIPTNSDGVFLTLTDPSVNGSISPQGTKLSTTNYILYGSITVVAKISKWPGVVSAFITMSDVFDEIDFEFTGSQTGHVLSNYFRLGQVASSGPGKNGNDTDLNTDLSADFHSYNLDWTKDRLQWSVDGNVIRTLQASQATDGYPSTPSRFQISIWNGGSPDSPEGTRNWAGGATDFSTPDYSQAGYYYNIVKSITIQCKNPDQKNSDQSYIYSAEKNGMPVFALSNQTAIPSDSTAVKYIGWWALVISGALIVSS